jgi:cytochrome P450
LARAAEAREATFVNVADSVPGCPYVDGKRFDPLEPEQVACPWPWLREAREHTPVFYDERLGVWCVTRYEDARNLYRDYARLSNRNSNTFRELTPRLRAVYPNGHPGTNSMLLKDPPAHTRIRKLVNKALTPKVVADFEPQMEKRANDLIDAFVGDGRCEFYSQFSAIFPAQVIADVIGAPVELNDDLLNWGNDYFALTEGAPPLTTEHESEIAARAERMMSFLEEFVRVRRETDHGDVISGLVRATGDDGEPALSDNEILGVVNSFFVAGVETTQNFLPLLMRELLQHRDQWDALVADPSKIGNAVEEGLRYWSPARSNRRYAVVDVTVGDVTIPAGSVVLLLPISANHDDAVFAEPETFDIDRANAPKHLGFGHGVHLCIGASVARLEAVVAVRALAKRIPGLRLAEDQPTRWVPHVTLPRLASVALAWEA